MKYRSDLISRNFDLTNLSSDQKKQLELIQKKEIDYRMLSTDDDLPDGQLDQFSQEIKTLKTDFESSLSKKTIPSENTPIESETSAVEISGSNNGLIIGAFAIIGTAILSALFIAAGSKPPKLK